MRRVYRVLKVKSDFNRVIALNDKNAIGYYYRGYCHSELGNKDEAVRDYSEAIDIDPDFAPAYYNRGIILSADNLYKDALTDFTKAIVLVPQDSDAYIQRKNVQFSLGKEKLAKGNVEIALMDYRGAIEDYTMGISYNPGNGEAYYNRGLVYLELKVEDKALADFQQAAAIFRSQGNEEGYQWSLEQIGALQLRVGIAHRN